MNNFKKKMEDKYAVPDRISPENMVKLIDENKASKKRKRIRLITSITSLAACCALIIGIASVMNNNENKKPSIDISTELDDIPSVNGVINLENNAISNNRTYKEIYNILSKINDREFHYLNQSGVDFDESPDASIPSINESIQESAPSTDTNGGSDEFSDTYQQVEGVAEADIIKTDGKFIYYLSGDFIYVMDLDGNVMSKTQVLDSSKYNYSAPEMFLVNNKIVFVSTIRDDGYKCEAIIFGITDKGELNKESSFTQDGKYMTSRMINNKLYIVSYKSMYLFTHCNINEPETYIPTYAIDDKQKLVSPKNIVINDASDYSGYAVISQIDINDTANTKVQTVFTNSPKVYCNHDNIYLMSNFTKHNENQTGIRRYTKHCYITRFSIKESLTLTGRTVVDGHVKDQFSGDEQDGYFRVVTNRSSDNALYIFDKDMKHLSTLGGMGENEEIKSVKFEGNIAYIVTFRTKDPLYTVDLSKPENPIILDELKISGFSTHLRRFSDNLLLGFGYEADESTGWTYGIKLSMFEENEKGEQTEIAKYSILEDENSYGIDSIAADNHKYLLIDGNKNIIGFPYVNFCDRIIKTDKYGYKYKVSELFKYAICRYTDGEFEIIAEVDTVGQGRALYIGDRVYIFAENAYNTTKNEVIIVDTISGETKEIILI